MKSFKLLVYPFFPVFCLKGLGLEDQFDYLKDIDFFNTKALRVPTKLECIVLNTLIKKNLIQRHFKSNQCYVLM